MATLGIIPLSSGQLYACSYCGLEDQDRAVIQAHVDAGCLLEQRDREWDATHHWEDGKGWVKNN